MNGLELFTDMDDMLLNIETSLSDGSEGTVISSYLKGISDMQSAVLVNRADIRARQNRVEMMDNRLSTQEIIATTLMSENEDIDYATSNYRYDYTRIH